jgi:hypothetical protein
LSLFLFLSSAFAKITGQEESKVYNRQTGEEEIKTINTYEFLGDKAAEVAEADDLTTTEVVETPKTAKELDARREEIAPQLQTVNKEIARLESEQ